MAEYDYPGANPTYGVTLNDGDVMKILPGGYAASVTINQGATQYIQGGQTLAVTVNGGGSEHLESGNVSSVTINAGGVVYADGGRVDNPYVNGGTLYVGTNATEVSANVTHGGIEYLAGSTIASTAYDGGRIVLDQPGYQGDTVTNANLATHYIGLLTINGGGTLEVRNGVTSGLYLNGGQVVIDSVQYDSSVTGKYDDRTGILTVQGNTGAYQLHVFDQQNLGFTLSADTSGAVLVTPGQQPVCFLPGARIATRDGEIAVEAIVPGCLVRVKAGDLCRVVWVGGGRVQARDAGYPVLIRSGAFADGCPAQDLWVTAGHSFLFEGRLIPIGQLVNGASIVQDRDILAYDYFHVQLERHAILFANGTEAESYRDDGNRAAFEWGIGSLSADNAPLAPVISEGCFVDLVWKRLAARAEVAWHHLDDEPDLHLLVDGQRYDPVEVQSNTYMFALENFHEVLLASRSVVPAEIGMCRDHRRLGVAIRNFWIEDDQGRDVVAFHSPALIQGFHAAEMTEGIRWTDGLATLTAAQGARAGPTRLGVELGCRARYLP